MNANNHQQDSSIDKMYIPQERREDERRWEGLNQNRDDSVFLDGSSVVGAPSSSASLRAGFVESGLEAEQPQRCELVVMQWGCDKMGGKMHLTLREHLLASWCLGLSVELADIAVFLH